jgi:dihydrofolate reductase
VSRPLVVLIAAVTRDGGIGLHGELLVRLADDLKRFKALTLGAPVVMGRKTWESIGRPLPGRRNIVISRRAGWHPAGAEVANSLDAALILAGDVERVFVIGGAAIYAQALSRADMLELTEIDAEFAADTYFPVWRRDDFLEASRGEQVNAEGLRYAFATYTRVPVQAKP